MLEVSRQAVSKWESGQTYPEMDKLIALSKIFKCSLDDLTNDDVKELNVISKKKNSFSNLVDGLYDLIKRSEKMFSAMDGKEIGKCIGFMFCVFMVLLILYIPFEILYNLGYNIFRNFGLAKDIILGVWNLLLHVIYIIFFLMIFIYIYKIKYLDKYDDIQIEEKKEGKATKDSDTKKAPTSNTSEIIIKKEPNFAFFNILGAIGLYFIKIFVFFIGIGIGMFFLALLAGLIIMIYLMFKGVFYFGFLLMLISGSAFAGWLLVLVYFFLFNRKINFKTMFIVFGSSLIGIGISIGLIFLDIANTTFVEEVPTQIKESVYREEYEFKNDFIISEHYKTNYKVDNSLGNKVVVEVTYYKGFIDPYIIDIENDTYTYKMVDYNANINKNILNLMIKDLKNKKLHNYDLLSEYETTIYASEETIASMEKLEEEKENKDLQNEQQWEKENNRINELEKAIDIKDEKIFDLEEENESLKEKLDDYKNRLKEMLE